MIIGKTFSSISKTEIFEKYSEIQVVSTVFNLSSLPCKMQSPFRVDNNPSFSIYVNDDGHVYYKDFGDNSHGSLLDLLCKFWNCSFNQVFDKILEIMSGQDSNDPTIKPKNVKVLTRRETSELTKIQVAVRPWRDYDYEYWRSYGIEPQWLRYAGVHAISHKIITKRDKETGKTKKYIFPADKLAYVFTENKENKLSMKIYQPLNKRGFKWCSSMDASVISLWTKVPEYGDRIIICSSLKDALCISCQLHIPAIAPQGEGYNISETACNELRRRYNQVFISFDIDEPGRRDAQLLAEKTGFKNIVPDLGTEKDYSDYYKSLEDKTKFKELETLFH